MTPLPVYALPGIAEPVAALTHLAGALAFTVLGVMLVARAQDTNGRLSLGAFSLSAVVLLAVSATTHVLVAGSGAREVLGRVDGAAIFVLIAGTHTGVHGLFFRGRAQRWPLLAMWVVTAAAITTLNISPGLLPAPALIATYLLFGWGAGLTGVRLATQLGLRRVWLPLAGGLVYSTGGVLLALHQPDVVPRVVGPHEVWHLEVLLGLSLYWLFLFRNARCAMQEVQASGRPAVQGAAVSRV
jgi:hemolysin III